MTVAEQGVVGAALVGPGAYRAVLALDDRDFEDKRLAAIAAVIRDMIRAGDPVDVVTAHAELTRRGAMVRTPTLVDLYDLMSRAPVPVTAWHYARIVRHEARKRRLADLASHMAHTNSGDLDEVDVDAVVSLWRTEIDALPGDLDDTEEDVSVERLLAEPDPPDEWIVPGLLTRGERVVLTGHEGRGKTVLQRQFAVCLAAGVHPWTGRTGRQRPARVVHIDTENGRNQTRRGYRMVERICGGLPEGWAKRIDLHCKPGGLDLPGRDAGWLHQVCAKASPDVIIAGPAYKLMAGDPQKDRDVLALLGVLDEVRVRHDAAILVEHHAPFGDERFGSRTVRPYGSSIWLRWPEVGVGMRNHEDTAEAEARAEFEGKTGQVARVDHMDLDQWRPPREDRDWPSDIRWGAVGALPWVPGDNYAPQVAYRLDRTRPAALD